MTMRAEQPGRYSSHSLLSSRERRALDGPVAYPTSTSTDAFMLGGLQGEPLMMSHGASGMQPLRQGASSRAMVPPQPSRQQQPARTPQASMPLRPLQSTQSMPLLPVQSAPSALPIHPAQRSQPSQPGYAGQPHMQQQQQRPREHILENGEAPIGPPVGQALAPAMKATLDSMLHSLKNRLSPEPYSRVQDLVDSVQNHKH